MNLGYPPFASARKAYTLPQMTERAAKYVSNPSTSYRRGVSSASLPIFYEKSPADESAPLGRTDAGPADSLRFAPGDSTELDRAGLPSEMLLFRVLRDLYRILDRDLAAAGIPKRDQRGRTVDVHALRHSFGTLLSRAGVAPRTAQAAMRHSSLDLTMTRPTCLPMTFAKRRRLRTPPDTISRRSCSRS